MCMYLCFLHYNQKSKIVIIFRLGCPCQFKVIFLPEDYAKQLLKETWSYYYFYFVWFSNYYFFLIIPHSFITTCTDLLSYNKHFSFCVSSFCIRYCKINILLISLFATSRQDLSAENMPILLNSIILNLKYQFIIEKGSIPRPKHWKCTKGG